MGYVKQTWVDEAIGGEKMLYTLKNGADGSVIADDVDILAKTPIVQAGSPVSAARMNHIEDGIEAASNNIVGQIPDDPIFISYGVDLNTLTVPGFYYCPLNDIAGSLLNCPTERAFGMTITRTSGINQEIKPFYYGDEFRLSRNYYEGVWGTWKKYLPNEDTGWINFTLLNGWLDFGLWGTPGYRKVNNVVTFRGLIKKPDTNYLQTITVLPAGFIPLDNSMFPVNHHNANAAIKVMTDGTVAIEYTNQSSANTWVGLSSILFIAGR